MSVCYTKILKLLYWTAVVKENLFDFKIRVVRHDLRNFVS